MSFSKTKALGGLLPALALAFATVSAPASADSNEPIRIPIKNWSSQIVMAHVIGGMFEDMGSTVEYVPVDNQASFEAVRNGDLTVVHEVWQSTMQNAYYNLFIINCLSRSAGSIILALRININQLRKPIMQLIR